MRVLLLLAFLLAALPASDPASFWDTPRVGANWFNTVPRRQWLQDARAAGLEVVRMTPSKWKGTGRDFLVGDCDDFRGIPPEDLRLLRQTLDQAAEVGVPMVVVPLSLPGARWSQHNNDRPDPRLWLEERYVAQAAAFWRELATALRGHPSVVGYDLLNEPIPAAEPERLNEFNRRMLAAIREVDPTTPVLVEPRFWAHPQRLAELAPLPDPRVLYSFHMYEPEGFTDWRHNSTRRYRPGEAAEFLQPVVDWQRLHGIPSSRILAGEFGCHRRLPGADVFLRDVGGYLKRQGWHRAFYSFREDEWDGMNYELGAERIRMDLREALQAGASPPADRAGNPLWKALWEGLR